MIRSLFSLLNSIQTFRKSEEITSNRRSIFSPILLARGITLVLNLREKGDILSFYVHVPLYHLLKLFVRPVRKLTMNLLKLFVLSLRSKKILRSKSILRPRTQDSLGNFLIFPWDLLLFEEVRSCTRTKRFQGMRFFVTEWYSKGFFGGLLLWYIAKSVDHFVVLFEEDFAFLFFD